ncbi:hypothetical protein Tco_0402165 [Tanacetum coccineum]
MFTKADESPTETDPEITFDSESKCDIQESLPPIPKLLGAEPTSTSTDVLTLADLTQTPVVSEEIKKVPEKRGKRCEKNYSSVRRYVADPDNAYPKRSITKLILKGAVIFDVVFYQFRCALNYSELQRIFLRLNNSSHTASPGNSNNAYKSSQGHLSSQHGLTLKNSRKMLHVKLSRTRRAKAQGQRL